MADLADTLADALDLAPDPFLVFDSAHPDWPIAYANRAFRELSPEMASVSGFEEAATRLFERNVVLDIAEAARTGSAASQSLKLGSREFILEILPLARHAGCFSVWLHARVQATTTARQMVNASRRSHDAATRNDSVTGLLTETVFRDVLRHDWAVAEREQSLLCVMSFRIEAFEAYQLTFGKHGADACLKKVGQTIRSRLRRASDIVARAGEDTFLVLSHAPDESRIGPFADLIASSVRELGLHHPRSPESRFVTVSSRFELVAPSGSERRIDTLVDELIA